MVSIPQSACRADSSAEPAPLLSASQTFSPLPGKSALYTREPFQCADYRICGSGAEHAREIKFDEPIGSAGCRP